MKRYLHNTVVVFRTALRFVVMAPLIAVSHAGEKALEAYWALNDKLPGAEAWKAKA